LRTILRGLEGIIKKIIDRVGTTKPVYLSLDIDTLDPAFAPATGTPETGGWSTRELRTILRGLEGINLVAADIVEVAVRLTNFVASCLLLPLSLPHPIGPLAR
jgi:arginase family enzyme